MNDLTISAAALVIDDTGGLEGVLGAHILLSGLNEALREITDMSNSYAMIVERETGFVVANSLGQDNYILDVKGKLQRINISDT